MPCPLSTDQRGQLRADLTAIADHLDAVAGSGAALPAEQATTGQAIAVPTLYTLLAPHGPNAPVLLRSESVDPALWADTADLPTALTAFSVALANTATGGAGRAIGRGVYGYALAYRPALHPDARAGEPAGTPRTPHVILAVGRDGEVFLAGTGSPGPHYRMIAQALERMVLAAQPTSQGPDQDAG